MTDTHTHPYLEDFSDGGANAVRRALAAGVTRMILPNVDAGTVKPLNALHERFPDSTFMAMGLHPTEVAENWRIVMENLEAELHTSAYVAVGEVGIDLYWDKSHRDEQLDAFSHQLTLAHSMSLPVIIHCREGLDEVLDCIRATKPDVPLVFHSFTGSPDDVRTIRSICDPMFGINGVVTFKNAKDLQAAVPMIGTDRILLETDAPYLAPVPHRGKRNEPAFIFETCRKVAQLLDISPQELEHVSDLNANATFSL